LHELCIELESKVAEPAGAAGCLAILHSMCYCLGQMVIFAEEIGIAVDIEVPASFMSVEPPHKMCVLSSSEQSTLPIHPQNVPVPLTDSSEMHEQLPSKCNNSHVNDTTLSWSDAGTMQLQCVVDDVCAWLQTDRAFRVLSIDSYPDFQTMFCSFLEACGLSTTKMSDGPAALQSLKQPSDDGPPDMVLLNLPMDSAVQVCSDIRDIYQCWEMPILVLQRTGGAEAEVVEATLNAGANDWLSLPAEPGPLLRRIEAHLCCKLLAEVQLMFLGLPVHSAIPQMQEELLMARSELERARSDVKKMNLQMQRSNIVEQAPVSSGHGHQASPAGSTVSQRSLAGSDSHSIASSARSCVRPQWMPKDQELMDFLTELGLSHYAFQLESNSINLEMIAHMTDDELQQVGLTALGARILIRMALQPE